MNKRSKKDGDAEADFFRVSAWGNSGVNCSKYLSKGRKVCVVGSVSANAYIRNDGSAAASMEVFAEEVEFLSPKDGYTPVNDPDDPFAER